MSIFLQAMTNPSHINVYTQSLNSFAVPCVDLPNLDEIEGPCGSLFRGSRRGVPPLWISASDAYEFLELQQPTGKGEQYVEAFDVENSAEVERLTGVARGLDAVMVGSPSKPTIGGIKRSCRIRR